jgi:hypothetical protein
MHLHRITLASVAFCFGHMANAEDTTVQQPSASTASPADGSILNGNRKQLHAKFEFEDLTCPLNQDGGLVTKIVNEAMKTVIPPQGFATTFVGHSTGASDVADTQALKFPFYRPNCAEPALLNEHAKTYAAITSGPTRFMLL